MNDFTTGSIPKKMLRFMIPVLGALILQAMYSAVDLLIVGWFGTKSGISAVSTGSNIVNLIVFTIAGLSMGITVLLGRYIGGKETERCGKVIGGAICFFAAASVLIAVFLILGAPILTTLMQAPEEARDLTILYVRICGGGIFFIIAYNVISSIFRGLGDSQLPLLFVLIACIVNIFGDLLFVAGFHMNVAGAAIATVMAQAVSVILSLVIIRKKGLPFSFSRKDITFNTEIQRFVKIGAPIAFQEILTNVSFLILCSFINRLGLDASAGYGIANKIVSFILLVPGSLMQSMASFVAQNVGAGKEKRSRKAMFTGMAIGCSIGVVIMYVSFFHGSVLASIFTNNDRVILRAAEYLRGFCLEPIVTSMLFSFMGFYNGHSKTFFVMLQGLAQSFVVRVPMSIFMSLQPNASLTMIGLAAPTATVFGILINAAYYYYYTKDYEKKFGKPTV
ncbi:MAG: MATE family efflux transporter [Eubacteriales bacterium]|nr:MATE family efflux transporter [Eubacteriales bacterium]